MRATVATTSLVLALLAALSPAGATPPTRDPAPPADGARTVAASARVGATAAVAAGGQHSCRVRGDGSLWCWGSNSFGQLGVGRQGAGTAKPEQVASVTPWAQVAAGGHDTCGIKVNRNLWCWGLNHRGQLGDGTTESRTSPVRVAPRRVWAQVDVGWFHTCAIRTDTSLWCWGDNSAGQLGVGSHANHGTGVRVPGTGWAQVSVQGWNTCATRVDGSLWCWGRNLFGQLGNKTWRDSTTPARVGRGVGWRQVDVSWTHACAVTSGDRARCWGRNDGGQLGDGTRASSNEPRVVAGQHAVAQVAVSEGSSCAVDLDGRLWCWGSNTYAQLGDGAPTVNPTPRERAGSYATLSGGWLHLCATTATAGLACWGNNENGQLGSFTTTRTARTAADPAPGSRGAPTDPFSFRIASFNVLANGHTRAYAHDDRFAPSRVRSEWTAGAVTALGAGIVGLQETTAGQLQGILEAAGGAYASFPTPAAGDLGVETALLWRKSTWEATRKTVIRTQFISRVLPRPVVRLRHRETGREIWVVDVHNAPWEYQDKRNEAVKVEIAKIQELEATGLPVFFVGDMNEKKTILCKVLRQTGLVSPLGGELREDNTCVAPDARMRVDWIFGSSWLGYQGYEASRHPLVRLSTDHWVPVVKVVVP